MVYKKNPLKVVGEVSRSSDAGNVGRLKDVVVKVTTAILVAVVVLLVLWFLAANFTNINLPFGSDRQSADNSLMWSAIFLSNSQVYFGKVGKITDRELILTDIYYLQMVTVPLQRTQEGIDEALQTQQELKLMKLGNELHGPNDRMVINRDHILLVEKLKNNGRVVMAINDYLEAESQN